jgi:hypothetical protein
VSDQDKIGVYNAMDDPAHRELLEEIVARMRVTIAPLLNDAMNDEERFGLVQGLLVTAGPLFGGLTAGHMLALGKMKPQDKARAGKVVAVAFRHGMKLGEHEARRAMLGQRPVEGTA